MKFLVVFLFTGLISEAQVAGYLGKRFSVGYSNYFMLAGIGPTANSGSPIGGGGLNTTHCLNFEYTIKNRTNFCVSIQKSKTGMDPGEMSVVLYNGVSSYDTYTVTYSEKPYKPMQINSLNVGLGFKFFQSGTLAPIGKYRKLELLLLFNHLEYKRNAFTYYNYNANGYVSMSKGLGDYNFNSFSIAYTLGRSRVLFDRVVLDYGLRFGLVPGGVWAFLDENDLLPISSTSSINGVVIRPDEKQFKYDTYQRLFRYQMLNMHIGLSFLAF